MQHRGALVSSAPTELLVLFLGGAAVSAAPTELLVQFLLGWCTSCSGKRQSRAETSAPPMSCWCTYCLVGALETSAPPMDTTKRASTALISTT